MKTVFKKKDLLGFKAKKNLAKTFIKKELDESNLYTDWMWQAKNLISTAGQISTFINLDPEEENELKNPLFKFAITPHLVSLMDKENFSCPIRRQFIPTVAENNVRKEELSDPCGEDKDIVCNGVIHRYPDRVLLLLTNRCFSYCRFCSRKRFVGQKEHDLSLEEFEKVLWYLQLHTEVRDVIISGGDPLVLTDEKLEFFIKKLRSINHIEILRIHTRAPVSLPQRITKQLCSMLKEYGPLFVNIHINHPKEFSNDFVAAVSILADAGIPLGSQTVLLKDINDNVTTMRELFTRMLKYRIKPYYLYQCDIARGISHFRTDLFCGIKIMKNLQGFVSGMAVPHFVVDVPYGGGKIPLSAEYMVSKVSNSFILRNYEDKLFFFPQV